jgi:AcrR family transcriptional regulator
MTATTPLRQLEQGSRVDPTIRPDTEPHARYPPRPGTASTRRRSEPAQVDELTRTRILNAAVTAVTTYGVERVTVERIIKPAGVSKKTFYRLFENRDDCVRAALEDAVAVATGRAERACAEHEQWVDRIRAALHAVLELFDEEPQLALLLVVHTATASPATVDLRLRVLKTLATLIDDGRETTRHPRPSLTAEATVAGTLGLIHTRLLTSDCGNLTELLGPLMSFVVLPYRGTGAARRELHRPARAPRRGVRLPDPPWPADVRMTYRTMRVLAALAAQPGLSNTQTRQHAGIKDNGQISKLLRRLASLGLVANRGDGPPKGASNAWHLTPKGEELARAIDPEPPRTR